MASKKKDDEMKFEDALARLEALVEEMEAGELPLEDIIKKYELGMNLAAFCTEKLSEAEEKIEILSKKRDGSRELRKFGATGEVPVSNPSPNEPGPDPNDQESLF